MKPRVITRLLIIAVLVPFASFYRFASYLNNIDTDEEKDARTRRCLEKQFFRRGLLIRDDNGQLVELTADEEPISESARRGLDRNVYYYLYTKSNPWEPQQLSSDPYLYRNDFERSYFNDQLPTFFVTHGWLGNYSSESCTLIRDAILKENEANVIVIDWSSMSHSVYATAANYVPRVSDEISRMMRFLVEDGRINPNETTLVGHSLGAHVIGIAGYHIGGVIGTIIGLDPAYPMFTLAGEGSRISRRDGKHVQIIHTNAGFLGFEDPIGTADFFVCGGTNQLGCGVNIGGACSHARSYMYYAESINTADGFYGRTCVSRMNFILEVCGGENFARMGGFRAETGLRGTFYMWTNTAPPFAKGIYD